MAKDPIDIYRAQGQLEFLDYLIEGNIENGLLGENE